VAAAVGRLVQGRQGEVRGIQLEKAGVEGVRLIRIDLERREALLFRRRGKAGVALGPVGAAIGAPEDLRALSRGVLDGGVLDGGVLDGIDAPWGVSEAG
jgi:hypothetical protein